MKTGILSLVVKIASASLEKRLKVATFVARLVHFRFEWAEVGFFGKRIRRLSGVAFPPTF